MFSVNFQLSKAASLSGLGVTASFWSAVERVRIFTSVSTPRRFARKFKHFFHRIISLSETSKMSELLQKFDLLRFKISNMMLIRLFLTSTALKGYVLK